MTIREELERREREVLAPQAAKSAETKGRLRSEVEDPIRPSFQRDRDRIIHTKAFRRLKHKTQVFFSPTGDHYRTRLTHTLEVSQIARTATYHAAIVDVMTRLLGPEVWLLEDDRFGVVYELRLLAEIAAAAGDLRRAGVLLGATEAEHERAPVGPWIHGSFMPSHLLEVDDPQFARGREEGRRLGLDDAVSIALTDS